MSSPPSQGKKSEAGVTATFSLFVYGTLVHPPILSRVLSGSLRQPLQGSPSTTTADDALQVIPALLPSYEIRRVKGQEYPALLKLDEDATQSYVRGVVVHNLTLAQILSLDRFEGEEYSRIPLTVLTSSQDKPMCNSDRLGWDQATISGVLDAHLSPAKCEAMLKGGGEGVKKIEVQSYLWVAAESELDARDGPRGPWVFSEFAGSKAGRWTTGEWSDEGGPDGVQEDDRGSDSAAIDRSSTATPIPTATRPGRSGFDEIQRSMSYEDNVRQAGMDAPDSFSTLSIGADPWADPPSNANTVRSDNPWASGDAATTSSVGQGAANGATAASSSATGAAKADTAAPDAGWGSSSRELEGAESPGYERFGKPCRRLWYHGDTKASGARPYLNMNAGAFGSCPKPVMEASHAWNVKAEENPDLFRRSTYPTQLRSILSRLSSERLPHCPTSTLALIRNATTGTNAVLRGIPWQEGDHILCLSTVYGALDRTIDYIIEHSTASGAPKPIKVTMEVTYPISHEELLKTFTAKLSALRSEGKRVRLATFDAVSSHPGVLLPWERLCVLCKEHSILSLVDAAHAFGQIDCSLLGSSAAPADFWVSNVHKWSFAPRGCAIFYVPAQNRHFVPSTLPTSWGWKAKASSSLATHGVAADEEWAAAWRDPGTDQVSHYLSVDAALDFVRDRLGGEERVRRYNTSLARIGGAEVARILGTEILDVEGKEEERLTACMVTVRLPLVSRAIGPDATKWMWQMGGEGFFFETLQDDFATNIPILAHNNRVYARLSAQVWLDVDDFAYAGRALKEVCQRVNEGEMPAAKASVGAEAAGQPVEEA